VREKDCLTLLVTTRMAESGVQAMMLLRNNVDC
jgi:hypothetical protein